MKKILGMVGMGAFTVASVGGILLANALVSNAGTTASAPSESIRPMPRPACFATRDCTATEQAPTTSPRPVPRPEQVIDLTPYAEEGEPTVADRVMGEAIAEALREAIDNN